MKLKNYLTRTSTFIIFISLLFLCSCKDNPVTNPINTKIVVNGKTIDRTGNGISNVTVSIEGMLKVSGPDGSFSISGVTTPYDLKVVSGTTALEYKGLTVSAPQIYTIGVATLNSCLLTVNIPSTLLVGGQQCRVYFTDGANVLSAGTVIPFGSTFSTLTVRWNGGATITGKVIALIDNITGGVITSYVKYGEKINYTVNNGGTQTQNFASSDINVAPGNSTVSGSITVPAGYSAPSTSLILGFGNVGSGFSSYLLYSLSSNTFIYNVPTGLTTAPNLFVGASATFGPAFTLKYISAVAGSSGNTVSLETVSTLSLPPNAATNIDTNSSFTFTSGSGTGVNILEFVGPGNVFYVFTTGAIEKIPNFSSLGINLGANLTYTWRVIKYLGFSSVDEFVSSGFINNSKLIGETISDSRTFTTRP